MERTGSGWKLCAAAVTINRPRSEREKPRSRWRWTSSSVRVVAKGSGSSNCNSHAGLVQHADRMRRHRGHHACPHVAGGADTSHPGLRQMHDECRVLYGSHTVGDALHVELAQTIPDATAPAPSPAWARRPSPACAARRKAATNGCGLGNVCSSPCRSTPTTAAPRSRAATACSTHWQARAERRRACGRTPG